MGKMAELLKGKMIDKLNELEAVEGPSRGEEFNQSIDGLRNAIENEQWSKAFQHYEELAELADTEQ